LVFLTRMKGGKRRGTIQRAIRGRLNGERLKRVKERRNKWPRLKYRGTRPIRAYQKGRRIIEGAQNGGMCDSGKANTSRTTILKREKVEGMGFFLKRRETGGGDSLCELHNVRRKPRLGTHHRCAG